MVTFVIYLELEHPWIQYSQPISRILMVTVVTNLVLEHRWIQLFQVWWEFSKSSLTISRFKVQLDR